MLRSRFQRILHDRNYLLRLLLIAVIWYIVCNVGVKGMNYELDWFRRGLDDGNLTVQELNLDFYNEYFGLEYESLEELVEDFAIPYLKNSPTHILENMVQDASGMVALIFIAPLLIGTAASRSGWQLAQQSGIGRVRVVLSAVVELWFVILILNAATSLLMLLLQLGRADVEPYYPVALGHALRYLLLRPLVQLAICGVSLFLVFLFQGSFFSGVLTMGIFLAESFLMVRYPELLQEFMPVHYLTDLELVGQTAPEPEKLILAVAVCLGAILFWSAASVLVLRIRDLKRIEH